MNALGTKAERNAQSALGRGALGDADRQHDDSSDEHRTANSAQCAGDSERASIVVAHARARIRLEVETVEPERNRGTRQDDADAE